MAGSGSGGMLKSVAAPTGAMLPKNDGTQVMEVLGLQPGPEIGEALAYLMDVRLERGPISESEAIELLRAWAERR